MPIYTRSFFRIDDSQRSECCQNYLHQRRASYSPQIYDVYVQYGSLCKSLIYGLNLFFSYLNILLFNG